MDISLKKIQRMMIQAFLPEYKRAAEQKHTRLKKLSRVARITAGVIGFASMAVMIAAPVSFLAFGASMTTAAVLTGSGLAGIFLSSPISAVADVAQKLIARKAKQQLKADIHDGALLQRYQQEVLHKLPADKADIAGRIASLTPPSLKAAFLQRKQPLQRISQALKKPFSKNKP